MIDYSFDGDMKF